MIHEVSLLVSVSILFIKYGVLCPEDVIISSRGGHNINIGDVIEVYHPEDAHHALFLVTTLSDDLQNRDVISVEQSLALTFKLQQHKNVIVNVMNKEVSFSNFHSFHNFFIGTVVHVNKKLTCNETRKIIVIMIQLLYSLRVSILMENNCNHDTTVVFFTRIYIDVFYFFLDVPSEYSQSFKQDALSRYYEDFYR
ncbi:uncharacterized protein DC041_0008423 [Schistosoma bovis]|uniref:IML1 N-terminal double psi beta-barrel domain-containing protein n=1 Tax=Schistosoma bovis TaxID=6184 RepID=A0A430QCU6_SCHBO|nr:uncharacterized protein DC041_0008423 [Schistosoma bovis]